MSYSQHVRRGAPRPLVALMATVMAALALVLAPTTALAAGSGDYTYENGSLGFFKWIGADEAVKVIEESPNKDIVGPYQDLDNMDDLNSAFNLDNMYRALDNIEYSNELRANHDAPEARVDPYLMAISQVNTNFSNANYLTHSNAYANVSENIAWGFENPYSRWYDEEKGEWVSEELRPAREYMESLLDQGVRYEDARSSALNYIREHYDNSSDLIYGGGGHYGILHYLNLIHPMWVYTGAASAGPGTNWWDGAEVYAIDEQTFYYTTPSSKTYTVDEFRAKLAEYRAYISGDHSRQISVTSTSYGRAWVSASKANPGDVVTVRLAPDEGYVVDGSPLIRPDDGSVVLATPTANPGEFTFVMPDANVTVAGGFALRFNDVNPQNPGHWFVKSVMWAADNGIMNGYDNGTGNFGPNDGMKRSQVAGVFYNRAGQPAADVSALEGYTDVKNDWYTNAVAWAVDNGVIVGNAGKFRPEEDATRQEFVTILWRVEGEPDGTGDLSSRPDGDEVSDWACAAMEWALGAGVINGNANTGEINPTDSLTRAEAAAIIMNWSNL